MAIWNSTCHLIAGTGIGPGNQAYFDSASAREGWFLGKSVHSFSEYSIIRHDINSKHGYNAGCAHLAIGYDDAVKCDYIMFKNQGTPPGAGPWFYGRVSTVEYVNPNSCRIHFDMDWYSTYGSDVNYGSCLVERSHVKLSDDWSSTFPSYKFTLPEPVNPILVQRPFTRVNSDLAHVTDNLKPDTFVAFATTEPSGDISPGIIMGGVPTPGTILPAQSLVALAANSEMYKDNNNTFISTVKDITSIGMDKSNIQNIYNAVWMPGSVVSANSQPNKVSATSDNIKKSDLTRADGKPVKNAKCLTFPYCSICFKTPMGDAISFKPQDFYFSSGTQAAAIKVTSILTGGSIPQGAISFDMMLNTAFISFPPYPQLALPGDGYAAWAATQGQANTMTAVNGALSVIGGVALMAVPEPTGITKNFAAGALAYGTSQLAGAAGQQAASQSLPDSLLSHPSASFWAATDNYKMAVMLYSPSDGDLQRIDEFFEIRGYTLHSFQKVDLKVRQNWTYIKTNGAQVTGAVPSEAINYINNILDSGCTFWNATACEPGVYKDSNPDA